MTVAEEDIPMIEGAEGAEDSDEDMMVDDEETDDEKSHSKKVHVSVITGFLGSGKSTVSRNRCMMCLCLCNIIAYHVAQKCMMCLCLCNIIAYHVLVTRKKS